MRRDDVLTNDAYKRLPANEQASIDAALKRYNGIGVRIEDDILITESAPRILSGGSPRTILAIEQWMVSKPMTSVHFMTDFQDRAAACLAGELSRAAGPTLLQRTEL